MTTNIPTPRTDALRLEMVGKQLQVIASALWSELDKYERELIQAQQELERVKSLEGYRAMGKQIADALDERDNIKSQLTSQREVIEKCRKILGYDDGDLLDNVTRYHAYATHEIELLRAGGRRVATYAENLQEVIQKCLSCMDAMRGLSDMVHAWAFVHGELMDVIGGEKKHVD